MFIEILFKMLLFKGGVLIYAEHCIYVSNCVVYIIYIYGYFIIMSLFVYCGLFCSTFTASGTVMSQWQSCIHLFIQTLFYLSFYFCYF